MTEQHVLDLREIDRTMTGVAGGKGAQLGELMHIEGVPVPPGFCVTTAAFNDVVRLDGLGDDPAEIRRRIEATPLPAAPAAAITAAVEPDVAYAVRSSATAEDLPTASFAGQQDTYLDVIGADEVLRHVSKCWASLFTDRAAAYRRHHDFDDRALSMAVVVQRMVPAEAAGVMFTADPISGNRTVAVIDAIFGLGEALVSGLVTPDVFAVRDDQVVSRTVAAEAPLTDAQAVELVRLGRRIEKHFGGPQDIEWCRTGNGFSIVQARPITTLFPIPGVPDGANHVYLSVGHQQMMTDAMKPLGIANWQLTAMAPMLEAGGRLWVDATPRLTRPAVRAGFLEMIGRGDPLIKDALETLLARDFLPVLPDVAGAPPRPSAPPIATDPAIVTSLIERTEESLAALKRDIQDKTGPELFDFLLSAYQEHKRVLTDPQSMQVIMAGMEATWWLNDHLLEWLGEKNAADTLTLSAPGNITSEMGLALLDVADAVRPHPEVVAHLSGGGPLDDLPKIPGGAEAAAAIENYLSRYGMRCAGEIDISRPRWSEEPATLVPLILDNVRAFGPGAAAARFEQGRATASAAASDVLTRLRALPDGESKASETAAMIERVRAFIGYREYPKYDIICRYFVYKQALLGEADRLVAAGVLSDRDDIFYLTFDELHEVARTGQVQAGLIAARTEAFRSFQSLTPPRVLTSDGESITGSYHRDDVPDGALIGLGVSSGTIEGRARVILDMASADLEPGDILVTAYTDPSWSPLFVAVAGLVTEVGGLMTHGAVIAREYGLPAVVSVDRATTLIRDGQRIRVHGTDGFVELL